MQKIFKLTPGVGEFNIKIKEINTFIENNGKIISVTPNNVAVAYDGTFEKIVLGSWLIVADDGDDGNNISL